MDFRHPTGPADAGGGMGSSEVRTAMSDPVAARRYRDECLVLMCAGMRWPLSMSSTVSARSLAPSRAYPCSLCTPGLYAVNRHVKIVGRAATFEVAKTKVDEGHWSRRNG